MRPDIASLYSPERGVRAGSLVRRKATILDVDGSLCDISTALPHLLTPDGKDFEAFHAASRQCPPYPEALDYARRQFDAGHTLVVVTGRNQQWRQLTIEWLDEHLGLPYDGPFCRADGDYRPGDQVKREIHAYLSHHYDIRAAIDDDERICQLWRELGLEVTVAPGHKNWANPNWQDA